MTKSIKKVISVSLAAALIFSTFVQTNFVYAETKDGQAATANNAEDTVCSVNGTAYTSLKEAFEKAPNGSTVVLGKDITDFKTEDIVTIPKEKTVIFDMAENRIAVDANDFEGRIFKNNGDLTITGNGEIDTTAAGSKGWGPVDNYGTLTIENGAYKAVKETDVVGIWNRAGGTAYFNGGVYDGFPTIIRSAYGSTTTINGGTYTNNRYPAIENDGEMKITGGKFVNTSCSICSSNWGYTVRNGVAGENSHLVIEEAMEGSISITGVQGALANANGLLEVKSGSFETIGCEKHGTVSAHYALYVAGESGESKAVVTGGTFKSASKTAVHVGNDNTNGDGGINANATTEIKGGTFIAPDGQKAVTGAPQTGNPIITGGTFKSGDNASDISEYMPSGMKQDENGNVIVKETAVAKIGDRVYETLGDAIAAVGDNETITIIKDVPNATGISVPENKNFTIDFAGHTYIAVGPGAGSTGTETAIFQLLKNSNIIMKNGTIRIAPDAVNIKRMVQNYANVTFEDMHFYSENQVGSTDYPLTFNFGNIVFKGDTDVITPNDNQAAFDVYFWDIESYRDGVSVTFDDSYTGTINGKIVYDSSDEAKAALTIKGNGEFGKIEASDNSTATPNIAISGGTFVNAPEDKYLAEGMDTYKRADGTYSIAKETQSGEKPPIDPTEGFHWEKDENGNYVEVKDEVPPYIPPTKPVQKPIIESEDGATVALSKDGTTATIVIDKDATLKDVLLNGESLGAVTEVKNLKTGDKLVVIVETLAEKNAHLKAGVENTTIKLKSTLGKGYIKLNWTKSEGYKVDKYQVFRSTKRYSGYGTKAYFTTKQGGLKAWYKNTKELKKGTRYYYKVRGVREIAGETVYTQWSNKAWRLVK